MEREGVGIVVHGVGWDGTGRGGEGSRGGALQYMCSTGTEALCLEDATWTIVCLAPHLLPPHTHTCISLSTRILGASRPPGVAPTCKRGEI